MTFVVHEMIGRRRYFVRLRDGGVEGDGVEPAHYCGNQ